MAESLTSISRHSPPRATVASGDTVDLRVEDWCFGRLSSDPASYESMSRPRCPVAGPIDVHGAEVGDHVSILVQRIELDSRGTAARIRGVGPLPPGEAGTRVWDVLRDATTVKLAGLRFNIAPMIGIVGVRPDAAEPVGTRYTGVYGGNLDTREITIGARVELPVLTSGAGIFVGDLHGAMGDGELTATGCEFGGSVRVQIELVKAVSIPGPRVRFAHSWAALATAKDFAQATRDATRAMHDWIVTERGLDDDAAAFVIGMAGDLKVSQVVNPSGPTVKVVVDWTRVQT
jgi:amidase